jgi:hypothetical protein
MQVIMASAKEARVKDGCGAPILVSAVCAIDLLHTLISNDPRGAPLYRSRVEQRIRKDARNITERKHRSETSTSLCITKPTILRSEPGRLLGARKRHSLKGRARVVSRGSNHGESDTRLYRLYRAELARPHAGGDISNQPAGALRFINKQSAQKATESLDAHLQANRADNHSARSLHAGSLSPSWTCSTPPIETSAYAPLQP